MDRTEKLHAMIERAERLGLRLEFDSGLIVVRQMQPGDPERQDAIIEELGKHLSDVYRFVQRRAIGARATELAGQRIWSEYGEGGLARGRNDGGLFISKISPERGAQSLMSNAGGLLMCEPNNEGANAPPAPHEDEPKSQPSHNAIF